MTDVFGMQKVAVRWVPHNLSKEQKIERDHFASLASTEKGDSENRGHRRVRNDKLIHTTAILLDKLRWLKLNMTVALKLEPKKEATCEFVPYTSLYT